jgi:tetratricopeptide (TPR) repeat protein
MQGLLAWNQGHFVEADAAFKQALRLKPDSVMLTVYADRLADAGFVKAALRLAEKAHVEDPLNLPTATGTILARWLNGNDTDAIALAKSLPSPNGVALLSGIYASQGRFKEAADAMAPLAGNAGSPGARVVELLRKAPAAFPRDSLPTNAQGGIVRMVYPALGAWDVALANYERSFDAGLLGGRSLSWVWHPSNAAARRSDQFKRLMRKTGLVDFWRANGWPPQCHSTAGDDFACN